MLSIQKIIKYFSSQNDTEDENKYEFNKIVEFVDEHTNLLIKTSIDDFTIPTEEREKAKNRKNMFKKELELCGLGDLSAKQFIKSWITDLITQKYNINENTIDYVINFDFPNTYHKFLILLYIYMDRYEFEALKELIIQNSLDKLKKVNGEMMFAITEEDINNIYLREKLSVAIITFEDKLNILVQLIYEVLYGLNVIDEIREQKIDGISIGVNGIPIDFTSKVNDMRIRDPENLKDIKFSYDSIWLYFDGKEIWLKFLTFGSQRELERVCKKLYRFNNQRQFAKKDGYIFNNMADFSRVSVYRPPLAESWAAFIRKFDIDGDVDYLIEGGNSDIVKDLVRYLARGKQKLCITGQKGVGKTTMLVAIVKATYATVVMRVWESFFETFLRFRLPNRNTLALREMKGLSNEEALDSLKKANGELTIISEAADDQTITFIIKNALVGSKFIYWTYHNETADGLVQSCRNAGINTGAFKNENIAEEDVLSILDFEIHLKSTSYGKRYIERITEFIRLDQEPFNSDINQESFFENSKKYFEKKSGAKKYKAVNIIEYDLESDSFKIINNISKTRLNKIKENLLDIDIQGFEQFIKKLNELTEK